MISEPRVTVLVVEDDDAIAMTLQDVLEGEGYAVILAANGAEALDKLDSAESRPGVILLDLFMPVMDGLQLLDKLAVRPEKDIPVILMSAAGSRAEVATKRAHAAIKKPLELETLLETINRFSSKSRGS